VTRSGFLEGVHHGSAVALDPSGTVVHEVGEPAVPVLPRSALKPLQLLAMLRAGLDLPGPLLALAMASHSGEPFHPRRGRTGPADGRVHHRRPPQHTGPAR
jgi:L-asparaginase II